MIGALGFLLGVALIVWRVKRRGRRKDVRAGLVSTRPTFVSEPPRRLITPRSRETL